MSIAKPFIKWAGGKTQLMNDIINNLPNNLNNIKTYIEPFIGGGSVLFNIIDYFPNIENIIIMDINSKLINVYNCIKIYPEELINELKQLEYNYYNTNNKKNYYYEIKNKFNEFKNKIPKINFINVEYAAYFIFLNKTCFNGLYRENAKGDFNTPWNKSNKPCICDSVNIYNVHNFLNNHDVIILNEDYKQCSKFIDIDNDKTKTFIYFDPPYRPISKSSAFTAYTKSGFNDDSQIELKKLCDKINDKCYFMLSNSDPKNTDINDNFFDELYKDYNILRIKAKRNINSKGTDRGYINELLIKNY